MFLQPMHPALIEVFREEARAVLGVTAFAPPPELEDASFEDAPVAAPADSEEALEEQPPALDVVFASVSARVTVALALEDEAAIAQLGLFFLAVDRERERFMSTLLPASPEDGAPALSAEAHLSSPVADGEGEPLNVNDPTAEGETR